MQHDKWYLSHFIAPGCVHASLDMAVFMYNALTNANSPCTMIIFSSKYHKSTTATATGKVNGQQIFIAFDAERRARRACNIYCNSHTASEGNLGRLRQKKGKEDKKIIEQQQRQKQKQRQQRQQEQQLAVYCHCHSRKLHSAGPAAWHNSSICRSLCAARPRYKAVAIEII